MYVYTALPIDCIATALVNLASSTSQVLVRPSGSFANPWQRLYILGVATLSVEFTAISSSK